VERTLLSVALDVDLDFLQIPITVVTSFAGCPIFRVLCERWDSPYRFNFGIPHSDSSSGGRPKLEASVIFDAALMEQALSSKLFPEFSVADRTNTRAITKGLTHCDSLRLTCS
jgi:hypothetical protein